MKKIVLLSTVLAFAAQADSESAFAREAVEGFYAGLGVCWDYSINKIKATNGVLDNDGIPNDWFGYKISHKKCGKLGGTLVAGYGTFVTGDFYFGGEITIDITGNKTTNSEYRYMGDVYPYCTKIKGIVPTIAFRLGGWCAPIDSLIYTKLGVSFVAAEFQEKHNDMFKDTRKMRRFAPVVGVGIEKNVYDNFNVRLEGDYRFQVKKEDRSRNLNRINWVNVENRLKGFTVRVIAVCKL